MIPPHDYSFDPRLLLPIQFNHEGLPPHCFAMGVGPLQAHPLGSVLCTKPSRHLRHSLL